MYLVKHICLVYIYLSFGFVCRYTETEEEQRHERYAPPIKQTSLIGHCYRSHASRLSTANGGDDADDTDDDAAAPAAAPAED